MQFNSKGVLALARDTEFIRHVLGGDAHVSRLERVGERTDDPVGILASPVRTPQRAARSVGVNPCKVRRKSQSASGHQ